MKIYISLFLVSFFAVSCGSEQNSLYSNSKVKEFENLPSGKYKYAANDTRDYFFDFVPLDHIRRDQWVALDWKVVDKQFRPVIEKYQALGGYSLCIQTLVCDFLDKCLLKSADSKQKSEVVSYYLNVLIEEKNPYWPLLTESLLSLENKIDDSRYEQYKDYIINDAGNYIKQYKGVKNNARIDPSMDGGTNVFIRERLDEAESSLQKLKK